MARPLMFQSEPWQPVMTMRAMQGRFLLRPGSEANRRILGVLARAMEVYAGRVELYFAGGTSNHLHIIAAFDTAESKALWKSHVKTNISKELGELYDWSGSHWDRRTRDIHILDDEAFADRLAYLGRHGMKDGLVSSSDDWPGIQWVRAVTDGKPLKGLWYDRSALDAKRRAWARKPAGSRGARPHLMDAASWKPVPLSHSKPKRSKRSPAPKVHTRCAVLRRMWVDGYQAFVEGYRAAMARLRDGWSAVGFPAEGCRPACLLVERGG